MSNDEVRYVTFGQSHKHKIGDKIIDHNCIAKVKGNRASVFELFGPKFCFEYTQVQFDNKQDDFMRYFPRGVIEV